MRLTAIEDPLDVGAAKADDEKPWDVTAHVIENSIDGVELRLSREDALELGEALVEAVEEETD